jgi:hypothetical protein
MDGVGIHAPEATVVSRIFTSMGDEGEVAGSHRHHPGNWVILMIDGSLPVFFSFALQCFLHLSSSSHFGAHQCPSSSQLIQQQTVYVAPRIDINTKLVWGGTRFRIRPQTNMGIPILVWG